LSLEYLCLDLQWGIERVREGFRNLYPKPYATYEEGFQLVFLPGWWNQNPIENQNVAIHVSKLIQALPESATKAHAINSLAKYAASLPDKLGRKGEGKENVAKRILFEEFGDPSETLSIPLPEAFKTHPIPMPTKEPEPEPEPVVVRRLGEIGTQSELEAQSTRPAAVSANAKPPTEDFDPVRDQPAWMKRTA